MQNKAPYALRFGVCLPTVRMNKQNLQEFFLELQSITLWNILELYLHDFFFSLTPSVKLVNLLTAAAFSCKARGWVVLLSDSCQYHIVILNVLKREKKERFKFCRCYFCFSFNCFSYAIKTCFGKIISFGVKNRLKFWAYDFKAFPFNMRSFLCGGKVFISAVVILSVEPHVRCR